MSPYGLPWSPIASLRPWVFGAVGLWGHVGFETMGLRGYGAVCDEYSNIFEYSNISYRILDIEIFTNEYIRIFE
jgi:hypothetical protein